MATVYKSMEDWILQGNPETTPVTIASGEGVVAARTPLIFDKVSGHFKKAVDATAPATRMTAYDVDATAAAKEAQVYKDGQFNITLVNWPAAIDTDAKKHGLFNGSQITVGAPYKV